MKAKNEEVNLSKNLKENRLKRNLTQRELAKKCGLDFHTISLNENKERNSSFEIILRLALGLNISLEELLVG
ncbi:helix-turn-helix domain-containing protein [Clostridium perfringens]|uniref:helix-turn-helix domain-containing protein n=1 Tax=Clostridium perfringens TaxID=1502 RepID=UPI000D7141DF|nr:helix-turn-helix transcriptional regulator [Clostridium perfringens]EGT0000951.1 helix-turn-helix transcriptional regulator [Clostridium perfringens]EIF2806855.1 helix-turn-helix transcriptional regulator [Clostridium perfringens]ELC8309461.1 helix-turn-helix transcriptional regulator [Clostridium perfringens]ELC8392149.1 helix-turn-helix transcriptional regulator [Clostridium perfringens]ELC8428390.1 helix-turn-helix transcriptional regulator [Clostridium perfringens]